ncbi:MAG: hypothetical protein C5B54_11265 [Acidobacteria bacterium]|nr:MAG: hypothetical protein C5B54_11265 [Acidobacteriota bacterium]
MTQELIDKLKSANDLTFAAEKIVALFKDGNTESFDAVFGVVEEQIIFGSDEVREGMISFLENLKNLSAWQDLDCAVFEPWLGAESHVVWRWLEKRWQGKSLEAATRKPQRPEDTKL